jgi:hypothetical protein
MWGALDPEPGETFVMQWRLQIDEAHGPDVTVGVFSDDEWAVGFQLNDESIVSVFESDTSASFLPGVFHDYELRSCDMREYELYIDGTWAITGSFWLSVTESEVGWGDGVQGASSLSRWDYFRFGVVPEPTAGLSMLFMLMVGSQERSRGGWPILRAAKGGGAILP